MVPSSVFDHPVYQEILRAALPFLQTRDNELHTRVSVQFASRLLAMEGGDEGVVIPAILLHDVGWSCVPEDLQDKSFGPQMSRVDLRYLHEMSGAAISRLILARLSYPADKTDAIALIVFRHDARADAETLEEKIVKDADKLWRFSREGVPNVAGRFRMHPLDYLDWTEERLDSWFLTPSGVCLAREELRARRREYDGSRVPDPVAA